MTKLVEHLYRSDDGGELAELVYVADVDWADCYEWDTILIGYHPGQRRFYWVTGSGCSCNWIGDDINSIADLEVGGRADMIRAVERHAAQAWSVKPDALAAQIAKLKTWKPDA